MSRNEFSRSWFHLLVSLCTTKWHQLGGTRDIGTTLYPSLFIVLSLPPSFSLTLSLSRTLSLYLPPVHPITGCRMKPSTRPATTSCSVTGCSPQDSAPSEYSCSWPRLLCRRCGAPPCELRATAELPEYLFSGDISTESLGDIQ